MPLPQGILDTSHLQCCNKVLHDTPPALELVAACIDCGMPGEDAKATLQEQMDRAAKIKSTFFPNKP